MLSCIMKLHRPHYHIILLFPPFSALLNWLAQPNELFLNGNWLFGLISYIPLYVMFVTPGIKRNQMRLSAVIFAVSFTLSSYFWLTNFGEYSLWTIGGVTLAYIGYHLAFFRLLYFLLAPVKDTRMQVWMQPSLRPLLFALAWTAFEFFKSRGYLAFPWNLAAYPFHGFTVFNQISELTGIWAMSFTILFLQAALAQYLLEHTAGTPGNSSPAAPAFLRRSNDAWRQVAAAASIILMVSAYGVIRHGHISRIQLNDETPELILLIQQNVDSWAESDPAAGMSVAMDLTHKGITAALEEYGRQPDIISWSETSLSYPYAPDSSFYRNFPRELPFREFLQDLEGSLITGAPLLRSRDPFVAMNGVLQISPEGEILQDYGKIHLIPFAEHVPLTDLPFISTFLEEVIGIPASGWTPGGGIRLFDFPERDLHLGTPVCFEDSFAYNSRFFVKEGADVLLNLTNNAWSQTYSAQMQHLVSARYRAIENRRPLLRATNGGVTSIIMPNGEISAQIPMFEADYLLAEIPVATEMPVTLYTRYGDWLAWLLSAGLLAALILRYRREFLNR